MLDLISRVFPELRNHIEEFDVGTPLTHMRYLGHPGGAAYGYDQHAKNTRLFITHAGNNGQLEALYHGVPMLAMPVAGDQNRNGQENLP